MRRTLFAVLFLLPAVVSAQGTITTVAGGVAFTFPSGPVAAKDAPLSSLGQLAFDAAGNLYAADGSNQQVVKITPSGTLTTVWRGGASPIQIAVDPSGNL